MTKIIGDFTAGMPLPADFGEFLMATHVPSIIKGILLGPAIGLILVITLVFLLRKTIFFKRNGIVLNIVSRLYSIIVPVIFILYGLAMGPWIALHHSSSVLIDTYTPSLVQYTSKYSIGFQKYIKTVFKLEGEGSSGEKTSISRALDDMIDDYILENPVLISSGSGGFFHVLKAKIANTILKTGNALVFTAFVRSYFADTVADKTGLDSETAMIIIKADLNNLQESNVVLPFRRGLKKLLNGFFYGHYLTVSAILLGFLLIPAGEIIYSKRALKMEQPLETGSI